jgi:CrcB protein
MAVQTVLGIAVAGAVGAVARYGMQSWAARLWGERFPWGTLLVNLVGCFLLGFLLEMVWRSSWTNPWLRVFLPIGLLGGFTTFSTFSYETLQNAHAGNWGVAGWNVVANLGLGLAATALGLMLARVFTPAP